MEEQNKMKKISELFNVYDTNKNGVLEKKEFIVGFKDLISSLDQSLSNDEAAKIGDEAIAQFDFNNNGLIEFNEFTSLIDFLVNEKGLSI